MNKKYIQNKSYIYERKAVKIYSKEQTNQLMLKCRLAINLWNKSACILFTVQWHGFIHKISFRTEATHRYFC